MQNITNRPKINLGRQHYKRAFTLIELLVVIAIIGILATVVIASLNSARSKGRIASIKSNLRNAITQAQIYHSENGTYTGLCNDTTIQNIVSALGSASCYVHTNTISDIDFGISATYNGTHFTADPQGVLQLDSANTGGTQSWDTAMASCANLGKRMSGASSLKALYNITNSTPFGFTASYYGSSTPHPTNTANAYGIGMVSGDFGSYDKSHTRYIRCGS